MIVHGFVYLFTFFTVLLFIISPRTEDALYSAGALDQISYFLVAVVMRDGSFGLHVLSFFYFMFIFFNDGLQGAWFGMAMIYLIYAAGLDFGAWVFGVLSVKFIDPAWDEQDSGLLLPQLVEWIFGSDEAEGEPPEEGSFEDLVNQAE